MLSDLTPSESPAATTPREAAVSRSAARGMARVVPKSSRITQHGGAGASGPVSANATTRRITSLDGLRGVAAFVVVLHHLSLVARPELPAAAWRILTQTPLEFLVAGREAVLVFFVLSGLAVALPALKPGFSWVAYYPARLLRLYLPVIAAVLFASALIVLVPRDRSTMTEGSWMHRAQAVDLTPWNVLSEMLLLRRTYKIDNVLWSLRWELFFSLLLPLFVWVALRAARRWSIVVLVLAAAASVAGRVFEHGALTYYPLFLAGTVIAVNLGGLREIAERHRMLAPTLGSVAVMFLLASWVLRPLVPASSVGGRVLTGLAGVGAMALVALVIVSPWVIRMLDVRPVQWLGRISFSLYLVHVPLIATLTYMLGQDRWILVGVLAIPLSLAVSALFYQVVEKPFHRVSRRAGRGADVLVRRNRLTIRHRARRAFGVASRRRVDASTRPGPAPVPKQPVSRQVPPEVPSPRGGSRARH